MTQYTLEEVNAIFMACFELIDSKMLKQEGFSRKSGSALVQNAIIEDIITHGSVSEKIENPHDIVCTIKRILNHNTPNVSEVAQELKQGFKDDSLSSEKLQTVVNKLAESNEIKDVMLAEVLHNLFNLSHDIIHEEDNKMSSLGVGVVFSPGLEAILFNESEVDMGLSATFGMRLQKAFDDGHFKERFQRTFDLEYPKAAQRLREARIETEMDSRVVELKEEPKQESRSFLKKLLERKKKDAPKVKEEGGHTFSEEDDTQSSYESPRKPNK